MSLEFGLWDHFERQRELPVSQQYRERIRLIRRGEEYGFYAYQLAEHHLTPLDLAPSQTVFLSAVAQHTSRIRLGTMVLCLPLYHPVRLLQEICMLDQISEGRFLPGVGRGIRDVEHQWFGLDPAESGERFDELFRLILRALSTGRLAHKGRYYQLEDVTLDFLTYQQPYPEFWYAGNLLAAGRLGLSALGGGMLKRDVLEQYWELWRASREQEQPVNPRLAEPHVGSTIRLYIAGSDREALARAEQAWGVYLENFNATPTRVAGVEVGRRRGSGREGFERALADGTLVAGSPETVIERTAAFLDDVGGLYNYLAGVFQWGDLRHEEAMNSLGLFATRVIPALRPLPAATGTAD